MFKAARCLPSTTKIGSRWAVYFLPKVGAPSDSTGISGETGASEGTIICPAKTVILIVFRSLIAQKPQNIYSTLAGLGRAQPGKAEASNRVVFIWELVAL